MIFLGIISNVKIEEVAEIDKHPLLAAICMFLTVHHVSYQPLTVLGHFPNHMPCPIFYVIFKFLTLEGYSKIIPWASIHMACAVSYINKY